MTGVSDIRRNVPFRLPFGRFFYTHLPDEKARAKAIRALALGLQFGHGLELLHASNALFDADRGIPIADFSPIRLEMGEMEPFSGKEWAPTAQGSGDQGDR
jgi:hypothetical protein